MTPEQIVNDFSQNIGMYGHGYEQDITTIDKIIQQWQDQ